MATISFDHFSSSAITQEDGADFNLAYIGADFSYPHAEEFGNAYMRQLFDYAYELGKSGKAWHEAPPNEAAREGR